MRRLLNLAAVFWVSLLIVSPAQAEVRVLTSIKPLQLIAAAVQDGVGTPEVLLPPGATPHNYALRPSDVRRVQEVELLYWIGPDMETFLPRVLQGRKMPAVAVQTLPGMHLRHFGEDNASHETTSMITTTRQTNMTTTTGPAVSIRTCGCRPSTRG